jgi:7-dehydrocholesterol reductase
LNSVPLAMHRWYSLTHLDGSLVRVFQFVREEGLTGVYNVWPRPSAEAWSYLAFFGAMQAAFQLLIPGPEFRGPVTPKGNTPVYKVGLSRTSSDMH